MSLAAAEGYDVPVYQVEVPGEDFAVAKVERMTTGRGGMCGSEFESTFVAQNRAGE